MSIFLESSKTDQFRDGAWVASRGRIKTLAPLRRWSNTLLPRKLILVRICRCLELYRLLDPPPKVPCQGLSYSRAREIVKDAFKDTTDVSCISLHSLRAGEATAAANGGINDRLFKGYGRWLSENAKDGYVKNNFQPLLSVSKSLGI